MKESIQAKKTAALPGRAGVTSPRSGKAPGAKSPETTAAPNSKKRWLLALGALFLMSGIVWAMWRPSHLTRYKQLQKQMFEQGKDLSPEERKQRWEALRAEEKKLTGKDKAELSKESQQRALAQAREYHNLSPEDKIKRLDNMIKQSEERRQQRAQGGEGKGGGGRNGGRNQGGANAGGPNAGGPNAGGPNAGGPNAGGPNAGGPPGGPPGGPQGVFGGPPRGGFGAASGGTPEDRLTRRKAHLDDSTPELRALHDEFRYDMAQRRQALGLPPSSGGGFGGFGGFGGPRGGGGGGPRRP